MFQKKDFLKLKFTVLQRMRVPQGRYFRISMLQGGDKEIESERDRDRKRKRERDRKSTLLNRKK